MTTTIEYNIYNRLKNDAIISSCVGSRIYSYLAPQNTNYPYIIFNLQSSKDEQVINDNCNNHFQSLYQIKVVDQNQSFVGIGTIAGRVNTLFQGFGTVSTDYHLHSSRDSIIQYLENDAGRIYAHLGGMYLIYFSN